jgi:hypothetical protein
MAGCEKLQKALANNEANYWGKQPAMSGCNEQPQVSGEWWYVEDRTAGRGYVPAAYLRPYRALQHEAVKEINE